MRIKNWHKFQHFKDRSPPWIKLYRDILDDLDWHNLPPASAKALVMIWLIASESNGELPDMKTLAFRLRMTETQVKTIVSGLSHWLEQGDITPISTGCHDGCLEGERETEKEGETEGPRKRGAHALPEDFVLSPDILAWCKQHDYDQPQASLDYMRDWAKSNGKHKSDWEATLRNCIKGDWGDARKKARDRARTPGAAPKSVAPDCRISGCKREGVLSLGGVCEVHYAQSKPVGVAKPIGSVLAKVAA